MSFGCQMLRTYGRRRLIVAGLFIISAACVGSTFSERASAQSAGTTRICRSAQIACLQAQNACGGTYLERGFRGSGGECQTASEKCQYLSRLCHQSADNEPPRIPPPQPLSGCWADGATGKTVSNPVGEIDPLDSNHANGGRLYRIPCPEPGTETGLRTGTTGGYLGGELVKNWGWVRSTERFAATDLVTNQFTDSADPFGGGVIVGYKFAPWANNIVASPFASFDFLHAPVNHTFPGGSFLGTTGNFMGTAGIKIGPQLATGVWLYGIAGVSVLNETLNINFIPTASARNVDVAGATVGLGGAWQPAFLQGFGRPVSLFAEYQHTWWQDASFNTPAASPFFNYTFRREDDVVKFGFTVSLGGPPPTPAPSYPVKAPMLK
jgi:hypothetical protein